jgi:hypothetical protein
MSRAQQAADFITAHCNVIGAYHGTGEPHGFLQETAEEMSRSSPTSVFRARHIEHVAYAIYLVASNPFLSPPAAVASVYLVTRFEFYFRVLSGVLSDDGAWISQGAQQGAFANILDERLKRPRVSNVSLAYQVMKLGTSAIVPYCRTLDRALYPSPANAGGYFRIAHIGDRIAYGRHAVGHGSRGDISAEAVFYGLMTALIFYTR